MPVGSTTYAELIVARFNQSYIWSSLLVELVLEEGDTVRRRLLDALFDYKGGVIVADGQKEMGMTTRMTPVFAAELLQYCFTNYSSMSLPIYSLVQLIDVRLFCYLNSSPSVDAKKWLSSVYYALWRSPSIFELENLRPCDHCNLVLSLLKRNPWLSEDTLSTTFLEHVAFLIDFITQIFNRASSYSYHQVAACQSIAADGLADCIVSQPEARQVETINYLIDLLLPSSTKLPIKTSAKKSKKKAILTLSPIETKIDVAAAAESKRKDTPTAAIVDALGACVVQVLKTCAEQELKDRKKAQSKVVDPVAKKNTEAWADPFQLALTRLQNFPNGSVQLLAYQLP